MNVGQLREYKNWINKSPVEIRNAVIKAGGWARVFVRARVAVPTPVGIGIPVTVSAFPEWASRVRNFFNVTPVTLELLPRGDRRAGTIKNRRGFSIWIPAPFQLHAFALNGDVYVDEHGRPWFEMHKVGGVYHYWRDVPMPLKKVHALVAKYGSMPIFKLISPDDTGGSMEVCVLNRNAASTFGKVGEEVPVSPWLVRDEDLAGSYNYAETVVRGMDEHEYRDVKPHKDERGFYVNPPLYSSITDRQFPESANGKPLG